VTYILNLGTPSISREPLNLKTSNLACSVTTRNTKEKNAKLGQMGSERDHVTYLRNFGSLDIAGRVKASNFKFGIYIEHETQTKKMQN